MKLDLVNHPCYWCEDSEGVFLCNSCHKYSCRDCKLGELEDGCVHKKKEPITSQSWDDPIYVDKSTGMRWYAGKLHPVPDRRAYGLYIENRLQDS